MGRAEHGRHVCVLAEIRWKPVRAAAMSGLMRMVLRRDGARPYRLMTDQPELS
jgi:hypothetical protein